MATGFRVRIRSPSLSLPEDFEIAVANSASVSSLKAQLITHPEMTPFTVDALTLIYQGRILDDAEMLAGLLKDTTGSQTFHLVLRQPTQRGRSELAATAGSSSAFTVTPMQTMRQRLTTPSMRAGVRSEANVSSMTASMSATTTPRWPATEGRGLSGRVPVAVTEHFTYHTIKLGDRPYLMQLSNSVPHQQSKVRMEEAIHALAGNMPSSLLLDDTFSSRQSQEALVMERTLALREYTEHRPARTESLPFTGLFRGSADALPPPPAQANQENRPVVQEAQEQPAAEAGGQPFNAAHAWLIFKLAVFAYMFARHASWPHRIAIYFVGFLIYLHQTGCLTSFYAWWARVREQQQQPDNAGGDERDPLLANDGSAAVAVNTRPELPASRWRQMERALSTFVTSLVPTEPDGLDPLAMEQGQDGDMAEIF